MTGDLRVPSRIAEHLASEHTMSNVNPWPAMFRSLHERLSASGPEIVVADSFERTVGGVRTLRLMTCGLVKPEDLTGLTGYDRMGYQVCTSGPYPRPREDAKSGQEPWFRIAAAGVEAEPLIHSWEHSNHTAFVPDTKFLMTYGLMPRAIPKKNQLHWDDPGAPRPDVVKGDLSTIFKWPNLPPAAVAISREYLLDYLALRQLDAHRKSKAEEDEALERALETFGIDPAETATGFGTALDAVYDGLAAELKAAGQTLFRQMHE